MLQMHMHMRGERSAKRTSRRRRRAGVRPFGRGRADAPIVRAGVRAASAARAPAACIARTDRRARRTRAAAADVRGRSACPLPSKLASVHSCIIAQHNTRSSIFDQ